ncbi:MAG: glycosyltransferase family 1 protein [Gemmatimonadaceae bacterium]
MLYYRIGGGTTRYAGELCSELLRRDDIDLRIFSLYPPEVIRALARVRGYPESVSFHSRLPRQVRMLLWQLGALEDFGRISSDSDLVHSPAVMVSPHGRLPIIVTVHDMTVVLFRQHHNRRTSWLFRLGLRQAIRRGATFIASSNATASDLMRIAGVASDRVFVTPLAADSRFRPTVDPSVLSRYGLEQPYILYVGTLEPRKGVDKLIRAFAALDASGPKLVIAGKQGWFYKDLFETVRVQGLDSRVHFLGFVPDGDLPALMAGAQVFVYPSAYEGFGLPVLEAMQCGTPVITTNVSSLPEVAGEAALMVPPEDVSALTKALRRVLDEPQLREEMRGRGLRQAAGFSWQRTAALTAEVYEHVRRRGRWRSNN